MDLLKLKKSISDYKENKNIDNFRKVIESCSCISDDIEKEYTIYEKEGEYTLGVKYSKQDLKEVKELLDEDSNLEIKSEDEDSITIGEKTSDDNKFVKKSIEKLVKKRKLYVTPVAIFDCNCDIISSGPVSSCVGMEYVSLPIPSIEEMLNSLLAEEYEAWYRYTYIASILNNDSLEQILKEIAKDELDDHSNKLLFLIRKLNLRNNLQSPYEWCCRVKNQSTLISPNYSRTEVLTALIRDEHLAIEHYKEVVGRISDIDCKNILKQIIADEEEHILKLNEVFK